MSQDEELSFCLFILSYLKKVFKLKQIFFWNLVFSLSARRTIWRLLSRGVFGLF